MCCNFTLVFRCCLKQAPLMTNYCISNYCCKLSAISGCSAGHKLHAETSCGADSLHSASSTGLESTWIQPSRRAPALCAVWVSCEYLQMCSCNLSAIGFIPLRKPVSKYSLKCQKTINDLASVPSCWRSVTTITRWLKTCCAATCMPAKFEISMKGCWCSWVNNLHQSQISHLVLLLLHGRQHQ